MKGRVVLCIVLFFGVCYGVLPGFKAIVTQSALNYGTKIGLEILEQKLQTLSVPDVKGNKDSITYTISNIVIHNLKIPAGSIKIDTSIGLRVDVADISGSITADWEGREDVWPHPSGHGEATVDVSDTSLVAVIKLYDDATRFAASADAVSTGIGHLDIHFSGSGLDFILNLLKDIFNNKIKDSAQDSITKAVTNAINDNLNSELRTLPEYVAIGKVAELDFGLVSDPIFHSSYLELPLSGTFYDIAHKTTPPYKQNALPSTPTSSDMIQTFVSEYLVDTASYAFYKAGKMKIAITNSEIPKSAPINLNTSSWAGIVPALYKKYPNWLMKLVASASEPPTLTLSTKGADVFGKATLDVYVISPTDGSLVPAFILGMNVSADGKAIVKGQYISGNLSYIDSGVWLEKSYIGEFDVGPLRSIVKFLTLVVVLPYFNYYLSIGIPIPSIDGVDFVTPSIDYGNGYIAISTDVRYSPPV